MSAADTATAGDRRPLGPRHTATCRSRGDGFDSTDELRGHVDCNHLSTDQARRAA